MLGAAEVTHAFMCSACPGASSPCTTRILSPLLGMSTQAAGHDPPCSCLHTT